MPSRSENKFPPSLVMRAELINLTSINLAPILFMTNSESNADSVVPNTKVLLGDCGDIKVVSSIPV